MARTRRADGALDGSAKRYDRISKEIVTSSHTPA